MYSQPGGTTTGAYLSRGFFFSLTGFFFGLTANNPSTAFSKGRGIRLLLASCLDRGFFFMVCRSLFDLSPHEVTRAPVGTFPYIHQGSVPDVFPVPKLADPLAILRLLGSMRPMSADIDI